MTFCWLSWKILRTSKRSVERKGKVARVTADETGKTLAWNIFEASSLIDIEGNGQVSCQTKM